MIKSVKGNLLKADTDALVNAVNCVGVMGKGIALQFRKAFPENFKEYAKECKNGNMRIGKMFVHSTGKLFPPKYIINFPTKRHWKGKSRLDDIKQGLDDLEKVVRDLNIKSIAIPPLGSGLGGLNWAEIRSLIVESFTNIPDVEVLIYEPNGIPEKNK
jgi:O-acetyl-ADP-ribose deacetylase (regulator of RNase III)